MKGGGGTAKKRCAQTNAHKPVKKNTGPKVSQNESDKVIHKQFLEVIVAEGGSTSYGFMGVLHFSHIDFPFWLHFFGK